MVFRDYPKPPRKTGELVVAVRDLEPEDSPVFPDNPTQFQVHLAGTSAALEALGEYLIALARSKTADPEPSESLNDVRNADGGTVRLIVRRLPKPLAKKPRSAEYKSGVCS
jgi:hypothetical protein